VFFSTLNANGAWKDKVITNDVSVYI